MERRIKYWALGRKRHKEESMSHGLSRRRYSKKPNKEAGGSWARLPRIHQSQREGILGKCKEELAMI